MPLPDLIAALEREGAQRVAAIRAEAEAEAAAIMAGAQARAAQQEQRVLQADDAIFELEARRQLAEARRAARARWLNARAELLERVRAGMMAGLESVLELPACHAQLTAQLTNAWQFLDGAVVVHCTPSIAALLSTTVEARPDTTVLSDVTIGHGFCLRDRDGTVEIGCTLEDAVSGQWPQLAIEIMRKVDEAA